MNVLNITDDCDSLTNSTQILDDKNDNFHIILKLFISSIPGSLTLLTLLGSKVWSTLKPLFPQQPTKG